MARPDAAGVTAATASRLPRLSRSDATALAVVVACQTMLVIDASIVNVALPVMRRALDLSVGELTWTVNAYTLAFGGLVLVGGRAGDLLGRRRVFIGSVLVFSAASLAGGLALDGVVLFAARAAQGIAAAVAAPNALALLMARFPDGIRRDRALVWYAGASGAGMTLGLLLGGMLTTWLSWRWVFFINVPVGAAIAALAPDAADRPAPRSSRLDLPGVISGTLAATAIVNGFIMASADGWASAWVLASFGAGIAFAVAFVLVERRTHDPAVPLWLFRSWPRNGAYLARVVLTAAFGGMLFLLTLFMENALGYSALGTGIAYLPSAAAIVVASRTVPRILSRYGPRPVLVGGAAMIVVGMAWLDQVTGSSQYLGAVLGPTVLFGLGAGLLYVAITQVALAGVPAGDEGAASGAITSMQQVGDSLGVAVLVTVYVAWHAPTGLGRTTAAAMAPGLHAAYLGALALSVLLLIITMAVPVTATRQVATG
jgi:MFS family permease